MGGRVAEEMVFGAENITSGASSDLKTATGIAKAMVTQFGMTDLVSSCNKYIIIHIYTCIYMYMYSGTSVK